MGDTGRHLLVLGHGYSAAPVAARARGAGYRVTATTRDRAKAKDLEDLGYAPLLWEAPASLPPAAVSPADVVLVSVSPDEGGCPAARAMPAGALRADTLLVYLSSSGVYGDHGGAWVDEDTPCAADSPRGEKRLLAEADWFGLADAAGGRATACRLAGIYGPGRNALATLRAQLEGEETRGGRSGLGQRIDKPGHLFNRIHRDDIAAGIMALIADPAAAPRIVNFADDCPSPSADPIGYAAELLGISPPPLIPFAAASLSPMARSFYADNKRLRNDRLKALLGGTLTYPTYREGLQAALHPR